MVPANLDQQLVDELANGGVVGVDAGDDLKEGRVSVVWKRAMSSSSDQKEDEGEVVSLRGGAGEESSPRRWQQDQGRDGET